MRIIHLLSLVCLLIHSLVYTLEQEEFKSRLHLPIPHMTAQEKLQWTLSNYIRDYSDATKTAVKTAVITSALCYGIGKATQQLKIKKPMLNSLSKLSVMLGLGGCVGGCIGLLDYFTDEHIRDYVAMYGGPRANSWLMARAWFHLQLPPNEKNKLLELPYKEFAETLYGSECHEIWKSEFERLKEPFHMTRVKQKAINIVKDHNQKIEAQLKTSKA